MADLTGLGHPFAAMQPRGEVVTGASDVYSAGAMLDDAKLGIQHARAWERFALVSDADWIRHVATLFGWIVPGDVRSFPYAELEEATATDAEAVADEFATARAHLRLIRSRKEAS